METLSTQVPEQVTAVNAARPQLRGFALGSVITALMLTLLLEALDQTVVGTALPRIIGSLQGFDRYTWAVTAYILASTAMIPIVGKLSDQFGRKWFVIFGAAIFLLGSILSGAAQTMNQFIAFRAIQGLGAGIGVALAFVVVADLFPPAERIKWQSLFGVVYGFSSLAGPTLGGWLTDHGPLVGSLVTNATRWRWVFYVNLPIGLIALAALIVYLPMNLSPRSSHHRGWAAFRRIDFAGAALATGATITLLLGLTWGGNATYAWSSPQVLAMLVSAGVLYLLFVVVERFAVEPVLPLDLFRNRVFAASAVLSLLQLMVLVGLIVYLPLFLQGVLGVSATSAGAVITPLTLSSVIGAAIAGGLVSKLQRYQAVTIVGALVMTAGVFMLTRLTPATSTRDTIIAMVIAGLGMGTFFSVLTVATQNALPPTRLGLGTGAVRYMGQLGSVLGVAVVGSIVNNTLASDLTPRLARIPGIAYLPPSAVTAATNPQVLVNAGYHDALVTGVVQHVPAQLQGSALAVLNQIFDALRQSLALAIVQGFVFVLLMCVATFLFTLLLKDVPFKQTTEAPAGE